MELESMCRTCLCTSSKFTPINKRTSYMGQTFTISKMIMACAPVEISPGDGLPSQVCELCLKLLYVSFIFRIRILHVNEKLKYHLRTKLVPDLQPVTEGFIEPLVMPSLLDDINIKYVFSKLHSTENETDPLTVDPFNLANFVDETDIKTDIKTEIKTEIFPIEEVLLPTNNTVNFGLNVTAEPLISINSTNIPTPAVTNTIDISSSPEISNSCHQSQPMPYQLNLDTGSSNLTESDTNLIQSVIQSMQNGETSRNKNTKFIIINATQTNNSLNNHNFTPTHLETQTSSSINSRQNLSFTKKVNALDNIKNTSNKYLPSTSQNTSCTNNKISMSNEIIPHKPFLKKPENHNFEGELMKFVEAREKYLETRQEAFAYIPRTYIKKKKNSEELIDLTNDDNVPDNISTQNIYKSKNSYQYKPRKNSEVPASSSVRQMPQNNKVIRLIVDQDDSSSIVIDD